MWRWVLLILGVYFLYDMFMNQPVKTPYVPDMAYAKESLKKSLKDNVVAKECGDTVIITCILAHKFSFRKDREEVARLYLDAFIAKVGEYVAKGYELVPGAITSSARGEDASFDEIHGYFTAVLKKPAASTSETSTEKGR